MLKRRLATLAAAPTLRDLEGTPGRFHQLVGDRAGQFGVSVTANYRLIFEPDFDPVPRTDDGGIDLGSVTKIMIKEVVDYHGN